MKADVYVCVDIEADGRVPGMNSMLSLGAAAFVEGNRTPVATFEINIAQIPDGVTDPETMAWWGRQDPETWAHVTKDPVAPEEAMRRFAAWVRALNGTPIMVVFPTWDYMWVQYYLVRYCGPYESPFGIGALDIKSLAYALLPRIQSFKHAAKRNIPRYLFEGCPPHTHRALDDALGQGVLLVNLLGLRRKQ